MKKKIFLITLFLVISAMSAMAQYAGVALTIQAKSNALTDSVLYYNKIIAAVYTPTILKRTADTSSAQIFPALPIGGLQFSVTSGTYYRFDCVLLYTSANAGTGPKIKMSTPTTTTFGAQVDIGGSVTQAKGTEWQGYISTIANDSVDATTTVATSVQYPIHIYGSILPSANGTVTFQFAASSANAITIKQGSYVLIESGY